jgi:hypothetical protein
MADGRLSGRKLGSRRWQWIVTIQRHGASRPERGLHNRESRAFLNHPLAQNL